MLLQDRERPTDVTATLDPEALIEEARRRGRRRRLGYAAATAFVAGAAGIYISTRGTDHSAALAGSPSAAGLCVRADRGWQSRAVDRSGTPPTLVLTNFQFGRAAYLYGQDDPELRWPKGGILISISNWTSSATKTMESAFEPTDTLHLVARDFVSFEGIARLGIKQPRMNGRLLQVWVQARPTTAATITHANTELANVRACA